MPTWSSPAPEANEVLAKATFYTENGKGEKRAGFWCRVERLVRALFRFSLNMIPPNALFLFALEDVFHQVFYRLFLMVH